MFRIDGGIVNDSQVDLFTDPEEAKDCAKLIIEDCYEHDRYANPEHPNYDDKYANEAREEYAERFKDAENLRNVRLNTDDDLVFLEVFVNVETDAS